jgi:hypothetical protein
MADRVNMKAQALQHAYSLRNLYGTSCREDAKVVAAAAWLEELGSSPNYVIGTLTRAPASKPE